MMKVSATETQVKHYILRPMTDGSKRGVTGGELGKVSSHMRANMAVVTGV